MNIAWNDVMNYVEDTSSCEPKHLLELRRHTRWNTNYWQMICSPAQGRFLRWISCIKRPEKILELGTFTGYSALCLSEFMPEHGKCITIDKNPETNAIARKFLTKYSKKNIQLMEHDIKEWLMQYPEKDFDIIFIDADKENYEFYYDEAKKRISANGMIVLDNMLWKGWVMDNSIQDPSAEILKNLTRKIMNDNEILPVFIPIRDGMILAQKI
jgi:predicted O-methyltransferase YrrM